VGFPSKTNSNFARFHQESAIKHQKAGVFFGTFLTKIDKFEFFWSGSYFHQPKKDITFNIILELLRNLT